MPVDNREKPRRHKAYIGADTGGTFTDLVLFDGERLRTHKILSTPDGPERAIVAGVRAVGADVGGAFELTQGSTVATNAVLEGKGVKTAYVTNRGFADTLAIARQARAGLYDLKPAPRPNPVPSHLCLETGGRVAANGAVLEDLSAADVETLVRRLKTLAPDAVAVNLLFSFLDARFEERLAETLGSDYFVSLASRVCPLAGEYERGVATWLNAYVGPLMRAWLLKLRAGLPRATIRVMQSHGKTAAAERASDQAVQLLLSGPAGGVIAVDYLTRLSGERKVLSFDMGGTSTDVSVLHDGLELTTEGRIGPYPVAVPMVNVHTIGAGGGSIVRVDEGGLLQVGPESAGATPGPACYGLGGGSHPTVTDANLLLGRLPVSLRGLTLDHAAAARAFGPLASALGKDEIETVRGVVATVDEQMIRALRATAAEKTHDPSEFLLVGFGAAGGQHVCALADGLGIGRALVPAHAGVLSALGMLVAPRGLEKAAAVCEPLRDLSGARATAVRRGLENAAAADLHAQGIHDYETRPFADLRYRGQWSCLTLPWRSPAHLEEAFHEAHEARYGHRLKMPVELAALKLQAYAPAPVDAAAALRRAAAADRACATRPQAAGAGGAENDRASGTELPVYRNRDPALITGVSGPAIIVEDTATVYLAPGWNARLDDYGNLTLAGSSA